MNRAVDEEGNGIVSPSRLFPKIRLIKLFLDNFPSSKAGMTSFRTRLLVKEKLVNLCSTREQIKLIKGKLVKENLVLCYLGFTYIHRNVFLKRQFIVFKVGNTALIQTGSGLDQWRKHITYTAVGVGFVKGKWLLMSKKLKTKRYIIPEIVLSTKGPCP